MEENQKWGKLAVEDFFLSKYISYTYTDKTVHKIKD